MHCIYSHAYRPSISGRKLFHGLIKDDIHKGIIATENTGYLPVGIQLDPYPLVHIPAIKLRKKEHVIGYFLSSGMDVRTIVVDFQDPQQGFDRLIIFY